MSLVTLRTTYSHAGPRRLVVTSRLAPLSFLDPNWMGIAFDSSDPPLAPVSLNILVESPGHPDPVELKVVLLNRRLCRPCPLPAPGLECESLEFVILVLVVPADESPTPTLVLAALGCARVAVVSPPVTPISVVGGSFVHRKLP